MGEGDGERKVRVMGLGGLRGWGSGCVGRVGPIKDSLTYHPSSQGWASRVLPLIICLLCGVCMFCVGCLVGFLVSFFSF